MGSVVSSFCYKKGITEGIKMTSVITKRIVSFKRIRATKKDNEDAECSSCRNGVEDTKYWYIVEQNDCFGLQLCDTCFSKLEEVKDEDK